MDAKFLTKDGLKELADFYKKAAIETFASNNKQYELDPFDPSGNRQKFKFEDGLFLYHDTTDGFFEPSGHETIKYEGKRIWRQNYKGEIIGYPREAEASTVFDFLRKALNEKGDTFQPRGPDKFEFEGWKYTCEWNGNIEKFKGHEDLYFNSWKIFEYNFDGGLIR